jgi:hypothetical protein
VAKVQDWPRGLLRSAKLLQIACNERLDHPIGCEIDVTILGHMTPHGQFSIRRSSDREPLERGHIWAKTVWPRTDPGMPWSRCTTQRRNIK